VVLVLRKHQMVLHVYSRGLCNSRCKFPSAWRWLLCQRVACRDNCDSPRNAADGATQCPDPQAASRRPWALSPPSVRIRRHPHPEQDGGSGGSLLVQPMKSVAMATCQRASFANRQTVRLLNPADPELLVAGLHRLQRCCVEVRTSKYMDNCGRPYRRCPADPSW